MTAADMPLPEPTAWMTNESAARLEDGGNSKGAVPVHCKKSVTAKNPLFSPHKVHAYAEEYAAARVAEVAGPLVKAADYAVRRLSADIESGSRPDQWSMELIVRDLIAGLAPFQESTK